MRQCIVSFIQTASNLLRLLFDENELFLFLKHIKGRGTMESFYEKKEFGSCVLQSSCKRSRIKDDFPFLTYSSITRIPCSSLSHRRKECGPDSVCDICL
ncbi:hypothetical protein CDAR_116141 [Caerostris darwini]|uniref:Uncharacterized protein n=1 Tax=Caerostris darwini TaxID=1538125 RepID=A0AAV4SI06_9ARAC|nr:hypothetical protein CDAR_116141 [Caerostris darwini]